MVYHNDMKNDNSSQKTITLLNIFRVIKRLLPKHIILVLGAISIALIVVVIILIFKYSAISDEAKQYKVMFESVKERQSKIDHWLYVCDQKFSVLNNQINLSEKLSEREAKIDGYVLLADHTNNGFSYENEWRNDLSQANQKQINQLIENGDLIDGVAGDFYIPANRYYTDGNFSTFVRFGIGTRYSIILSDNNRQKVFMQNYYERTNQELLASYIVDINGNQVDCQYFNELRARGVSDFLLKRFLLLYVLYQGGDYHAVYEADYREIYRGDYKHELFECFES